MGLSMIAGYPLGDGAIESANKRIPQARRKGSGMRRTWENVTAMLALRTVAANDRWAKARPALRAHASTQRGPPSRPPPARRAAPPPSPSYHQNAPVARPLVL